MFLYSRVKGECLDELKKIGGKNISILAAGLITERVNETDVRWGEKIGACIPFLDKIKCK